MEGGTALSPQARRVLDQYKDTPPPPPVRKKASKRIWFLSKAKRPGQLGADNARVHPAPQPSPPLEPQLPLHDDLPAFAPAISPLLVPRPAAPQPTWLTASNAAPPTRDRAHTTSAPPVDYVHARTSGLLGMFEFPLERRYREYWQQSYGRNARRGLIASMALAFLFGLVADAGDAMWKNGAAGGWQRFEPFLWMRLGGLCVVSCGLLLFRRVQPGQWGHSVWPQWATPMHLATLLFVCVYGVESSFVGVWAVKPGDNSLSLTYSLFLILIPCECATLLHINHTIVAALSFGLLTSSVALTVAYTDFSLRHLVVYAAAVAFAHVVYIAHAYHEDARTRNEFLSFCQLQQEEEVNQRLLLKMLPLSVIHKLRGGAEYVYEKYERVSVLFSHIDDFDLHTAAMQPIQLVRTLNKLFSLFDALTDEHRVYKVETIGDVFLVSSGCPAEYARDDHASALCVLAVDMMAVVKAFKVRHDETRRNSMRMMAAAPQLFSYTSVASSLDGDRGTPALSHYASSASSSAASNPAASTATAATSRLSHSSLDLRIGINTGPVIAGVVGVKYPRYRLMGDTINTASRMSTTCERGEIQLSAATHAELNAADFVCEQRARVEVKGKGIMQTYIVKAHKLQHRASATKMVQALNTSHNQAKAQSAKEQHSAAASSAILAGAASVASNGKGKPSPSLSQQNRPLLTSGALTTRVLTDRQRRAQLAVEAVAHSAVLETVSDSPLMRPSMPQNVSILFAPPLIAGADVSPLLSNGSRGVRVVSVYDGQDELADMIRAKSAQVVHLVPAAHRMSVSTAASSEVDADRMLQSAPVSAGHSREASEMECEKQLAAHIYPASAPLTPHESIEQQAAVTLLQPPKSERSLTDGLQATASTATTTSNTRSSLSLPVPSNSSLPGALLLSTHSSSSQLSAISTSPLPDTFPAQPSTSSTPPPPAMSALINSASAALSAPTFPAPPLASLLGAGALHPKMSISSAAESSTASEPRDPTAHPLAPHSPMQSSRVASQPAGEPAAGAHAGRHHRLRLASSESFSSASSAESARSSARGSVLAASTGAESGLLAAGRRTTSSVSQFPGTPSSAGRSRNDTASSPEASPRDNPLQHSVRLPALVIPHAAQPHSRTHSRPLLAGQDGEPLASTPSSASASSVESPSSTLPGVGFHGSASVSGPVRVAELNQSVHPSHLAASGLDFSPNTHYRFLLPSPSQATRDSPELNTPALPTPASLRTHTASGLNTKTNNSTRRSSRALTKDPLTADTPPRPAIATSSLLATVLRARGESNNPIIPPSAPDSAEATARAGLASDDQSTVRRRQRDVVITAHSQRVRTTKMFTYGDADALLHPPRPWLAKLSLTFITDARLEEEFRQERKAQEGKTTRTWTIVPLVALVCGIVYEQLMFDTDSTGAEVAVWMLRLLIAVTQLAVLWVMRDERRRQTWKQRTHFVAATVWCCAFIVSNFLQDSFLLVYGQSILLFGFSVITMFSALHLTWAALAVLLSLLCWLVTGLALDRSVAPTLGLHFAAACLFLGSSYSSEYRDRSSFLRFRRHANEKQTTQNFLSNLLPPSVIRSLTLTHSAFIAHERLMADVLFCDVVQFTALAARISPEDVVAILNVLFSSFDAMTDKYHVYKVETIGDAYLACSGVVEEHDDHTKLLVECGLAMRRVTRLFRTPDHQPIVVRIGIHSGFVIAGVVGRKMPRYHLFGETVSIAEEMEQRAPPGQVIISEATLHGMTPDQWKLFDFAPLEPIRIAAPSDVRLKYNGVPYSPHSNIVSNTNGIATTAAHQPTASTATATTASPQPEHPTNVRLIKRYMVRSARSAQLQREREHKAASTTTAAGQTRRHRMAHGRSHTMVSYDSKGELARAAGGAAAGGLQTGGALGRLKTRGSSLTESEWSAVKSTARGVVVPSTTTDSAKSSARDDLSATHESDVEKKESAR